MLAFDVEYAPPVARSARLEQRTTPQTKNLIEQAAQSLGVNATDFVVAAACREAMKTLELHRRTVLSAKNCGGFSAAFEAVEPTPALKEMMRLHAEVARV